MKVLLISGSLNPGSRSRILVRAIGEAFAQMGVEAQFVDLRDYPLPMCDGDAAYDDPNVARLSAMLEKADAVLLGVPVYTYTMNAALKNLVELTGSAWENKVVGFLCAAGGRSSYMSVMGFANSLMLDFRCLIVPRFIYAVKGDFAGEAVANADITTRIYQLAEETRIIAACGYSSLKG